jgi:hypothetical protein
MPRPRSKTFDAVAGRSSDRSWQGQEKRAADRLGGQRRAASGSKPGWKGDVDVSRPRGRFLFECKSTKHGSMRLKGEWLSKISGEAFSEGKFPALHVMLAVGGGVACEDEWVMMPMSAFEWLTDDSE